ncbi:MAG: hypothetical protein AABW68_03065 [archaeon]
MKGTGDNESKRTLDTPLIPLVTGGLLLLFLGDPIAATEETGGEGETEGYLSTCPQMRDVGCPQGGDPTGTGATVDDAHTAAETNCETTYSTCSSEQWAENSYNLEICTAAQYFLTFPYVELEACTFKGCKKTTDGGAGNPDEVCSYPSSCFYEDDNGKMQFIASCNGTGNCTTLPGDTIGEGEDFWSCRYKTEFNVTDYECVDVGLD